MKNRIWILLLVVLSPAWGQDYQSALPGYTYQFPRDHFNHPAYQTEWWYYTGNVTAEDGHRFGFELTFFRQGVSRAPSSSAWFVRDLWMAHLALSDLSGGRFYHAERLNRSGPGLAGVDESQGLIWNGNWHTRIESNHHYLQGGTGQFEVELDLSAAKRPVVQGQNGVSQKAEGVGHASHYISLTRLLTSGTIVLEGKKYAVKGTSWMDHEFFTGSMAANEVGWDWVSIQLDDQRELMLYRLRHKDGSIDPYSSGSIVDQQGRMQFLSSSEFQMVPAGATWSSPETKGVYPVEWRITIARMGLQMVIRTPLRTQELTSRFGPSYWEGAIDVTGRQGSQPLHGVGYLEMTGYRSPYHIGSPKP